MNFKYQKRQLKSTLLAANDYLLVWVSNHRVAICCLYASHVSEDIYLAQIGSTYLPT